MEYTYFGFSDAGKVRRLNEDSYLCNEKEGLFLVADGIGGHSSGEAASKMAVKTVEEFVIKSRNEPRIVKRPRSNLTPSQNRLLAGAMLANRRIYVASRIHPHMRGMGTTLIGVMIEEDHLSAVNVGDSRLYRIRRGKIHQITRDHTLMGEQENKGLQAGQRTINHQQEHVLTRAIGIQKKTRIDVFSVDIMPEDLFLMCSDGLYHMLDNQEILSTIHAVGDGSLYKIGLSLVLNANLAGGKDNITVVLISFNHLLT